MFRYWFVIFIVIARAVADQDCLDRGGRCIDWPTSICIAGWETGLCDGGNNRRCCLSCNPLCLRNERVWRANDGPCNEARGNCQKNTNFCNGVYAAGMCGGPADRQCCDPKAEPNADCPLISYGPTPNVVGLNGQAIRIHPGFLEAMNNINNFAQQCNVQVVVTHSFRKRKQRLQAAVAPTRRSNHVAGHAVSINLRTPDGFCNGRCLAARNNDAANCFINRVVEPGLRWGGNLIPADPVLIDDAFDQNVNQWKELVRNLQRNC